MIRQIFPRHIVIRHVTLHALIAHTPRAVMPMRDRIGCNIFMTRLAQLHAISIRHQIDIACCSVRVVACRTRQFTLNITRTHQMQCRGIQINPGLSIRIKNRLIIWQHKRIIIVKILTRQIPGRHNFLGRMTLRAHFNRPFLIQRPQCQQMHRGINLPARLIVLARRPMARLAIDTQTAHSRAISLRRHIVMLLHPAGMTIKTVKIPRAPRIRPIIIIFFRQRPRLSHHTPFLCIDPIICRAIVIQRQHLPPPIGKSRQISLMLPLANRVIHAISPNAPILALSLHIIRIAPAKHARTHTAIHMGHIVKIAHNRRITRHSHSDTVQTLPPLGILVGMASRTPLQPRKPRLRSTHQIGHLALLAARCEHQNHP